MSVRKVEQLVKSINGKKVEKSKEPSLFVKEAKKQLEEYFQTSVSISQHSVSIHYENEDDLNRLLDKLGLIEK